jgi:hypothetical protein
MKISKQTKQMMSFFTKYNHINIVKQNKRTDEILTELYGDICESRKYLDSVKKRDGHYTITTRKIETAGQIPMPKYFNSNSFPETVRKHIEQFAATEITYTFSLYNRKITLIFVVEDEEHHIKFEMFSKYVDAIIMWLYILNQYASKQCAESLVSYFYFTSLAKNLPNSNISILDEIHVNTAFTRTCPRESEIIVFRKEEWFKVFIHETFHNFALDFSDMNNDAPHRCILNIFKVKSDVNLYESYTEFWAEIMNALFCSYFSMKNKTNVADFLSTAEFFINFERTYSFFQLVKTLDFMGLSYSDLYSDTQYSTILRENLYKEKTNVLSYYILKTILINNYQDFLFWCKKNNYSVLQFNKTIRNQTAFCNFIENKYKAPSMLNGVAETQLFLNKISAKPPSPNIKYMMNNLRMSICELG